MSVEGRVKGEGRVSSNEGKNITDLTRLRLLLLVLSCVVVFTIKASALGATNARPRSFQS
jgi:hypothetical protein